MGVSGCDMPLPGDPEGVCPFSLENGLFRPPNSKKIRCAPYKGGEPPHTPTQIATLTATIMHAWFGPPVDVPGTEYTVNVREDENHPFARTTQG